MMVTEQSEVRSHFLGSFDPPHICHVFIAQYVLATTDVEQVWFLPCYQHAFGKRWHLLNTGSRYVNLR